MEAALSGLPVADGGTGTGPAPPPPTNTPPIARPGGPYSGSAGVALTVDGSGSSDAEGGIAQYRWKWGDEIVVNAADVAPTDIVGTRWTRVQAAGASEGVALQNPDLGQAKVATAAAAPASYVDVHFSAAAGLPYRFWFRMRAQSNSYANDSMFVQFSGAVDTQGQRTQAIGSTEAAAVVLDEGTGAGVSGWGWNDASYGGLAAPVHFAQSGLQTMRIQQREDGVMWDQIVLSSSTYFTQRPGLTKEDTEIVPVTFGTSDGVVAIHTYRSAAQYPILLRVTDTAGATAAAATTATIAGSAAAVVARAGGPYSGTIGQVVSFDGTGSSAPSSSAEYLWMFGDDVDASAIRAVGRRWGVVRGLDRRTADRFREPDATSQRWPPRWRTRGTPPHDDFGYQVGTHLPILP